MLCRVDSNPPLQGVLLQVVALVQILSKALTGRVHWANHSCNDIMVMLMQVLYTRIQERPCRSLSLTVLCPRPRLQTSLATCTMLQPF